jgi:hypothetical protein
VTPEKDIGQLRFHAVAHAPNPRVVNQMRKELVERTFQNIIIVHQKSDGFSACFWQVGVLVHVFESGFYATQSGVFRQSVTDDKQEEQKTYFRRKIFVPAQSVHVEIRAERLKRYAVRKMVPANGKKVIVENIEVHSRIFPEYRMHQLPDVEIHGMSVGKIVDGSVHQNAFPYARAQVFILASFYGIGDQIAYHQQLIVSGKINVRQKIHLQIYFYPVLDAVAGEIVAFRLLFFLLQQNRLENVYGSFSLLRLFAVICGYFIRMHHSFRFFCVLLHVCYTKNGNICYCRTYYYKRNSLDVGNSFGLRSKIQI